MHTIKPVIQLAKERALFRFTALAHPMLKDAINNVNNALDASHSDEDDKNLTAARLFLRQDAALFLNRFEQVFAVSLEAAMLTMCHGDRLSINQFSGQELTLIDEKIVHEQIEVDRLLQRVRKADDENITKINIIIAQLQNKEDVKESDNPFRPFLIARTLYEVLHEMVEDRAVSAVLLEFLSFALAQHLAEYYSAIRDVFEANGVHARLSARPSRAFRQLRFGDDAEADVATNEQSRPRVLSGLQRMQGYMQQAPSGRAQQPDDLQNFVRGLFDSASGLSLQADPNFDAGTSDEMLSREMVVARSRELFSQLNQLQRIAAEAHVFHATDLPAQNQLFSVGEQIDSRETTTRERTTIDIVSMLFEFILEDEQIPAVVRGQLARLQIPFLKAAMLAPEMLHSAEHPARVLLNRMSSSTIGLDLATPLGLKLSEQMTGIVKKILLEFDNDVSLFAVCLAELELFLSENLRNTDARFALSVDALEAAEQGSASKSKPGIPLQQLLDPLMLDQRAHDFFTHTWMRVINREAADHNLRVHARFKKLLPELVWSIQGKKSSERSALMRQLPDLVTWLKAGLNSVQIPAAESRQALDQFVVMHMDVLRGQTSNKSQNLLSLEALRQHFSPLHVTPDTKSGDATDITHDEQLASASIKVEAATITAALADRGVTASLDLGTEGMPEFDTDADWLDQMILGICVERWSDGEFRSARLNWISKKKILYIFMLENSTKPVVYSDQSLIKSLREGSIRTVESAPAFDRAVQSLLNDAEALQADSA
ncbi:MAG: DUF1631 family protein [Undibacterium sp.]|nr:DUF1631 family protein [Undibacterium sp.]